MCSSNPAIWCREILLRLPWPMTAEQSNIYDCGGSGTKSRKLGPSSCIGTKEDHCQCGVSCVCSTERSQDSPAARKFGCPYYRRYPSQKPPSISCAYPGFPTIFRVKEHLYRKHKASDTRCSRCHEVFDTEYSLEEHQRAKEVCDLRSSTCAPGFSKEQERQLRSRKRPSAGMSDEEKWNEIYRILFPKEVDVPSPYVDVGLPVDGEYIEYQNFSRHALGHALEERFPPSHFFKDLEVDKKFRRELFKNVLDCQEYTFKRFERMKTTGPSEDVPPGNDHSLESPPSFWNLQRLALETKCIPERCSPTFSSTESQTNFSTWAEAGDVAPRTLEQYQTPEQVTYPLEILDLHPTALNSRPELTRRDKDSGLRRLCKGNEGKTITETGLDSILEPGMPITQVLPIWDNLQVGTLTTGYSAASGGALCVDSSVDPFHLRNFDHDCAGLSAPWNGPPYCNLPSFDLSDRNVLADGLVGLDSEQGFGEIPSGYIGE